ncbi:Calcineurin-like phosphoesterase, partial [Modestobacter sp. DSM 44400]|uniref:metallophosphoesterase family protein n=1 Tax=Modestobacter sp. DSM 44400 TaxID=1550230 RepID=UPI000897DC0F
MKRSVTLGLAAVLASSGMTLLGAPSASAASCTVAAAGDIAGSDDYRAGAAATADLILGEDPEMVLALGDLAYDKGTVSEFKNYYHPTWGQFQSKTEAVPGNHEARSGDAGITSELGASAVENRGVDVCGWRVILVNQYNDIDEAAAFITADAKAHSDVPTAVVWHQPRFSSGSEHGSTASTQPMWAAATAAGARIVLGGHDHDYERFAPMNASGEASASGTREFVSGLGGHHLRDFGTEQPNSEVQYTGRPGALFLSLHGDGSYSWSEKTVDGTVRDSGSQSAPSLPAPDSRTARPEAKDLLAEIAAQSAKAPGGSADKTRQIARLHALATTP